MTLICLASLLPCISMVMRADPEEVSSSIVTSTSDTLTIVTMSVAQEGLGTGVVSTVFKAPCEEELLEELPQ